MEMVSTITTLISNVVTFAGGLLLLFGAVTLGTNLKDHNGPGISSGAWAMAGGVLRSEERRVGKECRSRWSPYH